MLKIRSLAVVLIALSLCSCTKKEGGEAANATASPAAGTPRQVNLAIWSNYVSDETLKEFERRTGIQVAVSNYSSNEELLAKLQAGASGYDVVVPSDYMVFAMSKLGLLKEVDRAKLPHASSLDPRFLKKPFDPENRYSVPYDWGTTGIAVNRSLYKGKIAGWKDLFTNPELKGKFTLLDDVRETIGAALKAQGLSLNTKSAEDLKKARELLFKARANVKAFSSEAKMPLVNGETAVAHIYVSDALQAQRETGGKVEYVLPVEGGTLWIDNLVIPQGAAHVAEAHEFIDYLLEAKTNLATVNAILVSPANKDVFALLPPELQKNPGLFPGEKALAKFEMMEDLGDALAAWDRVWTEVKAGGQ
jgi:spermidine/putrescine transport system substrate-binding protein